MNHPFSVLMLYKQFFFQRIPSKYSDPLNELVKAMLNTKPDERPR
jgi:hypothetical protein